jgi:hypothetical protein
MDVMRTGLDDYLMGILDQINQAALAVQHSYFLH